MQKGNKFRIYPNNEQRIILEKHFGSCRFVHNKLLGVKQTLYDKFRSNISEFELNGHLLILKECYPWLNETHGAALQQSNKNLHRAYKNFFDGRADFPKRQTKKDNHQSYQLPQYYKINIVTNEIYIPKVGWIKIKLHKELFDFNFFVHHIEITETENDIIIEQAKNSKYLKTLTVSRTPTGKYFVSILTNDQKENIPTQYFDKATTIGIDVGIKTFAAFSNGESVESPKFLKKSLKKLKHLQRSVSRKVKGSSNRKKAVKLLAKCYEKITNQRHDFQHKLSIQLIRDNQAVAIEDLNIKGMLKNHHLAQAISDSAWSSFVNKLYYKAEWFGKTVLKIGRFEPSSKTCSICGYYKKDLTLDVREWQCPDCKTIHDRDINAAINIKQFALNNLATAGRGVVDSLTLVKGMKQEALKSLA